MRTRALKKRRESYACSLWGSRGVTGSGPPHATRALYVLAENSLHPPVQGLVVAWNRRRYKWSALVVRLDESVPGGRLVQDWFQWNGFARSVATRTRCSGIGGLRS